MNLYHFSYDGSGCDEVNVPPVRGRKLLTSSSRSFCNSEGTDNLIRASSIGVTNLKSTSPGQVRNMADLSNLTRGHSPHFSPSRNNCKCFLINKKYIILIYI